MPSRLAAPTVNLLAKASAKAFIPSQKAPTMIRKPKQTADEPSATKSLLDSQFAATVKDSAQQIWLAGLGAFAKAQEEGSKVFDALVKEGAGIQKKGQSAAETKLGDVAGRMSSMAGEVSAKAGQQWDKLESIFEERTARALGKLGVPSAKDVEALSKRVDELSSQVAKLGKATPVRPPSTKAARPPASKAAAPRKTAAKRPARKAA